MDAIWAGRKRGVTTAALGTLRMFAPSVHAMTLDQFVDDIDMRYGGDCQFKWNGNTMWTAEPTSSAGLRSAESLLGQALRDFPLPPRGYLGWFYKA